MNHPLGYDQKQRDAILTTCLRCGKAFYMTKPAAWCLACREKDHESLWRAGTDSLTPAPPYRGEGSR